MERHDKYLIAVVALASMALLAVSIATAQTTTTTTWQMGPGAVNGMHGHMGMMNGIDPEEHKQIMQEHHPELTDEEIEEMFSEMSEHCPMMRTD